MYIFLLHAAADTHHRCATLSTVTISTISGVILGHFTIGLLYDQTDQAIHTHKYHFNEVYCCNVKLICSLRRKQLWMKSRHIFGRLERVKRWGTTLCGPHDIMISIDSLSRIRLCA